MTIQELVEEKLDFARSYLRCEFKMIPIHGVVGGACSCDNINCDNAGKHPIIKFRSGKGYISEIENQDEHIIKEWVDKWPVMNIGILTGAVSNIFVVDTDGPDGDKFLEQFDMPQGPFVRTSRGRHLYFRYPGIHIKNNAKKVHDEIDIRGDGGYAIAPPSVHASGSVYEWDEETCNLPFPDCPNDLLQLILSTSKGTGVKETGRKEVLRDDGHSIIPEGQRNDTLFHFGCEFLKNGGAISELHNYLAAINSSRCYPLLTNEQVEKIVSQAPKYAANQRHEEDVVDIQVVLVNGAELMRRNLPEIKWTVENIIPDGCTILAGAPKTGKSFMALDIGLSVASGKEVFGNSKSVRGGVIYLALEDTERRMQTRISEMGFSADEIGLFSFATSFPRQDRGGIERLDGLIHDAPGTRLVIIDTLELFRTHATGNKSVYTEDYKAMKQIKELANKHRISIMVVHHTKKAGEKDWVSRSSGSQALTGAVDTVLVLEKARNEKEAILHCTGRDIEEIDYGLSFKQFRWVIQGTVLDVGISAKKKEVIDILKQTGPQTCKSLASILGEKPNTVYQRLKRMVEAGLISKRGEIFSVSR